MIPITASGVTSDDAPSSRLRFINIHYFAAAASQFGTVAKGGYEYAGKTYDARFSHIPGYNACTVCHNSHSLEVEIQDCNTCHTGIKDPKDIRYIGSLEDYDGDGNMTEGMYYEIEALKAYLLEAMQAYARTVIGTPIAYDPIAYPYFFIDLNDNGQVDSNEATSANGYNKFSARLLRAAYNYQVSVKDPCGYVHNGKYIIELIYDSVEDLNTKLGAGGKPASLGIRRPDIIQAQSGGSGPDDDEGPGPDPEGRPAPGRGSLRRAFGGRAGVGRRRPRRPAPHGRGAFRRLLDGLPGLG